MGKKGRKGRKTATSRTSDFNFPTGLRNMYQRENQRQYAEVFSKMEDLGQLSLEEQKHTIRQALKAIGTDCDKNDADPFGDGDQSMIQTQAMRENAREIYSIGGDIHEHLVDREDGFSDFAFSCALGAHHAAQKKLDEVTSRIAQPWSRSEELKQLLEKRECSMRLSPLLIIVSAGKNAKGPGDMSHHVETAKLLLKYGASPIAKDVLGKTVSHYGAGAFATPMTLQVVDMCIRAAQTAHLYGKDVILQNLNKQEMNGQKGVVGGFNPDSGRRSVFLVESGREVSVKPENIQLVDPNAAPEKSELLTDVQDRLGSVSLHEVLIQDRMDVAEFLLKTHKTSIHTTDMDNVSPLKMSIGGGSVNNAAKLVNDVARKEGNTARKAKKQMKCASCQKELGVNGGSWCSRCKSVSYCGRECQKAHWTAGHKKECKKLSTLEAGVKIDRPTDFGASISLSSGQSHMNGGDCRPVGVGVDERFVVKIQAIGETAPIMVYDESRTCEFHIHPGKRGFREILTETQKEKTWNGCKTFMKASFDEAGICTIYPTTAGVKSKYSW